jgi:putative effector of murein hydrolase
LHINDDAEKDIVASGFSQGNRPSNFGVVISAVSNHGIGAARIFQGKSVAGTFASLGMALNALATAT